MHAKHANCGGHLLACYHNNPVEREAPPAAPQFTRASPKVAQIAMHNTMYPGTAKFQIRPASPQFANFSPPSDYPHAGAGGGAMGGGAAQPMMAMTHASANAQHHHSMSMRHPKSVSSRSASGHHMVSSNTMSMMGGGGSIGHHRGDLIFPDDLDSIEFCMPPQPGPSNGIGHGGANGDLLLMHSNGNGICEAFTERRRRGHSRKSNHKDVEQQVKWSRKNIAATMERFEPTTHSSSSTSSLEYGFAASVVTPSTTPSHPGQMSPAQQSFPGNGAIGGLTAPHNHVYSYAYYEPGAAKCHTNIPPKDGPALPIIPAPQMAPGPSKSPPRNSIRALLAKSFRSKSNSGQSTSSSPSADDRHTYTTRYGTTENLYEEVNDQKIRKVLSDNRIATSSVGNVKEELRRVQHNHFRVLDELNLSLEALIMPPTPPDISPNHEDYDDDEPSTSAGASNIVAASVVVHSAASTSQRPRRGGLLGGASSSSSTSSQQRTLSHASLENLSTTLNSMELKDHAHSSCTNPEFDEGDLDSGFSGSGSSSGASYNESLRYYKTGANNPMQNCATLQHNLRSCRSSTASGTSTSKSSMASCEDQGISMMTALNGCGGSGGGGAVGGMSVAGNGIMGSPFNYARRCSDTQRASARSASASSATGTKPKKNFWTIKP